MKKMNDKDQKVSIFTRDLQGEIFLHIRKLFRGW